MDDKELYSEKIRKVIGPIPPFLVVASLLVSAGLFIALCLALIFVPSPKGDGRLWEIIISSIFKK